MYEKNDNYIKKYCDAVPDSVLRWYPWVGKNYDRTRVLVVGESHYANSEEKLERYLANKESTINVIKDLIGGAQWAQDNRTFNNFSKAIVGDAVCIQEVLWNNLAYYNFVQRPMNYTYPNREKPTKQDFAEGCETFKQVISILKPSICIFIGVNASWPVIGSFEGKNINCSYAVDGKLNGINLRPVAKVNMPYGQTRLVFTKHSSHHYVWKDWHRYLNTVIQNEINSLCDKI